MDGPLLSHCMVDGKSARRCSSRFFDNSMCRWRNSISCADNPNAPLADTIGGPWPSIQSWNTTGMKKKCIARIHQRDVDCQLANNRAVPCLITPAPTTRSRSQRAESCACFVCVMSKSEVIRGRQSPCAPGVRGPNRTAPRRISGPHNSR